MTILPRRSRMSARSVVRARMAMISLATVMSKPVRRVLPFSSGPRPTSISRRKRSLVSITRRQVIESGSISRRENRERSSGVSSLGSVLLMPSFFRRRSMDGEKLRLPCLSIGQSALNSFSSSCSPSWNMRASMAAAHRLLAAVMAWMSPVRCRLKSSIGMICE